MARNSKSECAHPTVHLVHKLLVQNEPRTPVGERVEVLVQHEELGEPGQKLHVERLHLSVGLHRPAKSHHLQLELRVQTLAEIELLHCRQVVLQNSHYFTS